MKIKAKQLDEIYAKLPKLRCQRRCQDSCGPIGGLPLDSQIHGVVESIQATAEEGKFVPP
jgi:hypothetical protein